MEINVIKINNIGIARIKSDEILIKDGQSALDLLATVTYETDCERIIIDKSAIAEDFFDLSTKLAGEVLQKCINFHFKVAILGDFSAYKSNSLKDFIYECNKGKDIYFLPNEKQAVEKLSVI
jgi:hypothetical protein